MPAKRRRRSATSALSMEAIEIRKLMVLKEIQGLQATINELQAEIIERLEAVVGVGKPYGPPDNRQPQWLPSQQTPPQLQVVDNAPRVTTSPTGCQICGNPYAVFTEVRPGLSQYLCQMHARERTLQRAADAKVAAQGFSTDRTDARPQNIRLPEDNQRAKVLIHPTAADVIASRQHAQEASALQGDVQAVADIIDEAEESTPE